MSNTAYINIAFQTFGGMLSLMIILFLLFLKHKRSKLDWLYIRFLGCNTLVLFSNAATWIFDGQAGIFARLGALTSNFCVFALSYLLFGLFADYVSAFLTVRGVNCKKTVRIVWCFCIGLILSTVFSQFNRMYYSIDAQNVYHRQELFWISQVVPMISTIPVFWVLIHNRRILNGKELGAFLSYLTLPVVALMVQIFAYGVVYFHLATTFVAICIYIFIQSEQERKLSEQALELEQSRTAVMLSQIQPHFLYNALVGIKELCDSGEQQTTSKALEHFAYYLRGNMNSLSDKGLIPFVQEVSHVKDYLYLEKMRFEEKLGIVWDLQFTHFQLPPLTLQPIVENAVRHGITEKKGGGILTIRSEKSGDVIIITITDDGVGFDTGERKDDGRSHIGIENVRKRLAAQCGGALTIVSKHGTGTTAKIMLRGTEVDNENLSGGR